MIGRREFIAGLVVVAACLLALSRPFSAICTKG